MRDWILDGAGAGHTATADLVIAWCCDTLAGCRRPLGIAHFDLALACLEAGGERRSHRFRRLEPAALYLPGLREELAQFLEAGRGAPIRLAAALCSWGDIAHAALEA